MTIVATGSLSGFFHDIVEDAKKARRVDATDGATSYLVSLLADYVKPEGRAEQTLDRPLAFLLDEALHTPAPAERFDRLRALGDGVLYASGFFGDHYAARGVEQSYLVSIGATAYGSASSLLRVRDDSMPIDIYGELSGNFARFVEVIAEVADVTIAHGAASSRGLLRVYERWLKTGSESLAHTLTSHGLVPQRGTRGVLQ